MFDKYDQPSKSPKTFMTQDSFDHLIRKSQKLHIATICLGEMGHFIPMSRLVDALEKKGHKVTMLTNKYKEERCRTFLDEAGLKADLVCPDNITRDQLI